MNRNISNRTLPVVLLFLCQSVIALAFGPDREFIKSITREFSTSANGTTALYNKYGKINVNTWQNESVKIDVTIIVNAYDQKSADRTFEKINVNFTNTQGYIKAETMIGEIRNGSWLDFFPSGQCQDFKINYEVWIPATNQLDLRNRYGNSYVSALNANLTADIKYGDLRTEAISSDVNLNLEYGKAFLAKAGNVFGQVGYSSLTVTEVGEMQLDTRYSEIKNDRAGTVRLTSKYDDLNLGALGELRLQTKYATLKVLSANNAYITAQYTDIFFTSLGYQLDTDLSYGNIKVAGLSRNFTEVNVNSRYADVVINVEAGTDYRYSMESHYGSINTMPGSVSFQHVSEGSRDRKEGYFGDSKAKGYIKVNTKYAGVKIR
jgi:uncharacterized alkaline shock family protein YloU